ncbi:uncharacterized protein BO80DRAFT_465779 [Aspergillus ibericus CBS 121593]|uniref:Uncharacterized protein n=1 Tax=Aspergillus ibericus CBS 121593 TaxID=1448316 RepID=A0A395GXE2_9EURO|nr:hypothetical protein BO80DRAFT_465779 [Aspergillus ibericus CBS 121593]RAK99754.1 hypothetical protein BO80DRAFT_465779 [Aspergillus ibericus CBS 121593]
MSDQPTRPLANPRNLPHRPPKPEEPNAPLFFHPFQETLEPADKPDYPTHKPTWEEYQNIRALHIYIQNSLTRVTQRGYPSPIGITYKAWGDFNFEALFEPHYFWHVSLTCRTPMDIHLPHMKCLLANDIPGDDQLTRGELICTVNLMVGRLHTRHLRPHVVAPVMLFSLLGPQHLRVLEAYYNGVNLVVQKTRLYDMMEYDEGLMDLLMKWWVGHAVGETELITRDILVS